jgi:hypothetical protein
MMDRAGNIVTDTGATISGAVKGAVGAAGNVVSFQYTNSTLVIWLSFRRRRTVLEVLLPMLSVELLVAPEQLSKTVWTQRNYLGTRVQRRISKRIIQITLKLQR